jgi:hypothetical protein
MVRLVEGIRPGATPDCKLVVTGGRIPLSEDEHRRRLLTCTPPGCPREAII